ncbi:hypothetical protein L596_014840 [Steinernema carpocapsae]|uniref:Uncharacterized protein n=1 Tax=Steinernema carpocapsae TaxID=34508 RepID=A0A4U5NE19_STECR|nr:hypothetical protein L596_014840 [Steinernema carpocapsae]
MEDAIPRAEDFPENPDVFEIITLLKNSTELDDFLRKCELGGVFFECGSRTFNIKKPNCPGKVVPKSRQSKKDANSTLLYFCCTICRREISQNNANIILFTAEFPQPTTSFYFYIDSANRPNAKVTRNKIIYMLYAFSNCWLIFDTLRNVNH